MSRFCVEPRLRHGRPVVRSLLRLREAGALPPGDLSLHRGGPR